MATILIIDDTETDRQLAAQVARSMGNQVVFANNGEEGMAKAKEVKPDLILLDVVMPKQDGFATCRALKKDTDTANIPVVLVTSKGAETDKFWGKRQGAAAYLVKPYGPEALKKTIEELV
jgi:twitching motility two-component system response regulator PilH